MAKVSCLDAISRSRWFSGLQLNALVAGAPAGSGWAAKRLRYGGNGCAILNSGFRFGFNRKRFIVKPITRQPADLFQKVLPRAGWCKPAGIRSGSWAGRRTGKMLPDSASNFGQAKTFRSRAGSPARIAPANLARPASGSFDQPIGVTCGACPPGWFQPVWEVGGQPRQHPRQ